MNELTIINYILHRLASIDYDENDVLIAELQVASKVLENLPSYETDKIVEALFGSVEVHDA